MGLSYQPIGFDVLVLNWKYILSMPESLLWKRNIDINMFSKTAAYRHIEISAI